MQSDIFEERYVIKFYFKLGQNVTKTYGMLQTTFGASCMNQASVFEWHKRRKAESLWGMMWGVGGVSKSIDQSWLAKRLGLGLLCWGFKGVQEEIRSEEASTLQIGSVAFPTGQYTSPQLHPCHRLFYQGGHQDSSPASHSPDFAPCDFCLFPKLRVCRYETTDEMKEAVTKVIVTVTQEDFYRASQKLLEVYNKFIVAGGDYFEGD